MSKKLLFNNSIEEGGGDTPIEEEQQFTVSTSIGYIDDDGSIASDSAYLVTDFIDVSGLDDDSVILVELNASDGKTYKVDYYGIYDSSKNAISVNEYDDNDVVVFTKASLQNANYLRVEWTIGSNTAVSTSNTVMVTIKPTVNLIAVSTTNEYIEGEGDTTSNNKYLLTDYIATNGINGIVYLILTCKDSYYRYYFDYYETYDANKNPIIDTDLNYRGSAEVTVTSNVHYIRVEFQRYDKATLSNSNVAVQVFVE